MTTATPEGISPLGPITLVSIEDDAIDIEATGRDEMFRYLVDRDEKRLKFRPGQTPVRYTLRPLSKPCLVDFVNAVTDEDERHIRALMATLEEVRDLPGHPAVFVPESDATRDLGRIAKRASVIACVEPAGALYELGKLAYDRAHIGPKARRACFPPPGSLNRNSERLRVAAMKRREAEPPLPTPPSPDETSAPTGSATAEASVSTLPETASP